MYVIVWDFFMKQRVLKFKCSLQRHWACFFKFTAVEQCVVCNVSNSTAVSKLEDHPWKMLEGRYSRKTTESMERKKLPYFMTAIELFNKPSSLVGFCKIIFYTFHTSLYSRNLIHVDIYLFPKQIKKRLFNIGPRIAYRKKFPRLIPEWARTLPQILLPMLNIAGVMISKHRLIICYL